MGHSSKAYSRKGNRIFVKRAGDAADRLGRPDLAAQIDGPYLASKERFLMRRDPPKFPRHERRLMGRAIRIARRVVKQLGLRGGEFLYPIRFEKELNRALEEMTE